MFNRKDIVKPVSLESAINKAVLELESLSAASEDYASIVKNLDALIKADAHRKSTGVSKETLITVGANLVGIGMILSYEHLHVISSKALGFVAKVRI